VKISLAVLPRCLVLYSMTHFERKQIFQFSSRDRSQLRNNFLLTVSVILAQQPFTVKNKFVTKNFMKPRTWTDSLDKRPKREKMDMRFGLWNVRSLYGVGYLMRVSRELSRYASKLDLAGVQEVR
jgi:hypothetical protein